MYGDGNVRISTRSLMSTDHNVCDAYMILYRMEKSLSHEIFQPALSQYLARAIDDVWTALAHITYLCTRINISNFYYGLYPI